MEGMDSRYVIVGIDFVMMVRIAYHCGGLCMIAIWWVMIVVIMVGAE